MIKHKIIIIISILLLIYTICYFYPTKTLSINQTTVDKFNLNLLYERHPILIYDKIQNISQIIDKWFKYNIISQSTSQNLNWYFNHHKYCILYILQDGEIHICNPYTNITNSIPCNDSSIVTLNLKKNQIVIIPYRWYIFSDIPTHIIYAHDIITFILSNIF